MLTQKSFQQSEKFNPKSPPQSPILTDKNRGKNCLKIFRQKIAVISLKLDGF